MVPREQCREQRILFLSGYRSHAGDRLHQRAYEPRRYALRWFAAARTNQYQRQPDVLRDAAATGDEVVALRPIPPEPRRYTAGDDWGARTEPAALCGPGQRVRGLPRTEWKLGEYRRPPAG